MAFSCSFAIGNFTLLIWLACCCCCCCMCMQRHMLQRAISSDSGMRFVIRCHLPGCRKGDLWAISSNEGLAAVAGPGSTDWVVGAQSRWHGPDADGRCAGFVRCSHVFRQSCSVSNFWREQMRRGQDGRTAE